MWETFMSDTGILKRWQKRKCCIRLVMGSLIRHSANTCIDFSIREDFGCEIQVQVKNTGKTAGKHVVQAYVEAPQGKLGKSARSLCGFE